MSAVKMARNPYHLNNLEELFQELQQKFPEIPEQDIRHLMQKNGNDRSKCIEALGSKSCSYLYGPSNETKKLCGNDSSILNDFHQVSIASADIYERRSSGGRDILTSPRNCSDVTVQAPPHPSGLQQSKSEQHFTSVVEQFVEPGPISAPVVGPQFRPFGINVSQQYPHPEYRPPSYQQAPMVSSSESQKPLYVNETPPPLPPPIPKRQVRISPVNPTSSRGLSTPPPDVYQIKTPRAVSGGQVVVNKPPYPSTVIHYPNPSTGVGSPQHPVPPPLPAYGLGPSGGLPSPDSSRGGYYHDGTPIGVQPHSTQAYIFMQNSQKLGYVQAMQNMNNPSISSIRTGTTTSPQHPVALPAYRYPDNHLLIQTDPNIAQILSASIAPSPVSPPHPPISSPPPGELPGSSSPASGSSSRNFRSGSDPEKYTEALLSHQRARYDKLCFDLTQQRKLVETLGQQVAALKHNLTERRLTRNKHFCVSNEDLQKTKDENSRLQLDIQLLTREIDMSNPGNTPLGVVDENDVSFYENLHTGRQLVRPNPYPSDTKPLQQGPPIPPPRPPPPRRPPDTGQTEEEEGKSWSCSMCTFANHPALDKCEVCEMPRLPLDAR